MDIREPHKIEVNREGNWDIADYTELKNGDSIRMYDQDGNLFYYEHEDEHEYTIASEPYFDKDLGVWFVTLK